LIQIGNHSFIHCCRSPLLDNEPLQHYQSRWRHRNYVIIVHQKNLIMKSTIDLDKVFLCKIWTLKNQFHSYIYKVHKCILISTLIGWFIHICQ
jgi:hypothetical protein